MADESRLTNSAERILKLILSAQRTGGGNVAEGFARAFEIHKDDHAEMYRRLTSAAQETIFIDTLLSISGNADLEKFFSTSKSKIVQFFSPYRFDIQWDQHAKLVEPQDTKTLSMCSTLLNRNKSEVVIEKGQLKDVLKKIEELRAEILKADIPFDMKAIILENLKRLEDSIHDYDVRGAAGLHEATLLVGENVKNLLKVEKRNQRKKKSNAWEYLIRVAAITTIVANLVTSAGPLIHRLPEIHIEKLYILKGPEPPLSEDKKQNEPPQLPPSKAHEDLQKKT
jgi:hypothetical protein